MEEAHVLEERESRYRDKFFGKVFRTTAEVVGTDNWSRETKIPVGALVMVVGGEQVADATFKPSGRVFVPDDDGYRLQLLMLTRHGEVYPDYVTYDGAFAEMLEPEPGIPTWDRADSLQAIAQGWEIFSRDPKPSEGFECYELQAVTDDGRFKKDRTAHAFVWHQAVNNDSPLHKKALAFLYARAPHEYARVKQAGLDKKYEGRWP